MEIQVHHKDFIKNKITVIFSAWKIQVLYNGKPVKTKRGKYQLEDDNREIRDVKVVDYLITSPYITIDRKEKINIFPTVPKFMFIFIIPSILMIRFGVIGWAVGALGIYSIRNISIDESRTTLNKCLMNLLVIVISYAVLIGLLMILLAIMNR